MKMYELANNIDLLNEISSWKIGGGKAFELRREMKKITEELEELEKFRTSLINKYGSKNEKGQTEVKKDSDSFTDFLKEMNEALSVESSVKVKSILTPDDLPETISVKHIDFLIYIGLLKE